MTSKTYKIPTDVEYTVSSYGDQTYPDYVKVLSTSGTYAEFPDRRAAQVSADEGSLAAKAAVMYYDEQEEAKWKFGDIVTPDNHPKKDFWFVDSDPYDPAIGWEIDQVHPNDEYAPYRFIGFKEE